MRKVSPASVGTAPTTRQSVTKILNIADVSERLDFAANHDRSRRRISFSPRHSGEKLAKLSSRQGTTKAGRARVMAMWRRVVISITVGNSFHSLMAGKLARGFPNAVE
jgi:hypothetical protein